MLLGDLITEDLACIVASVFDGDFQPLQALVENPDVCEYVRSCGLRSYLCLLQNGLLPRDAVSGYFTELMRGKLGDDNQVVWSNLAIYCGALGLAHLIPEIQAAYRDGRCDSMFDREDRVVWQAGNGGDPDWKIEAELIEDVIGMTRNWHCFEPKPPPPSTARRANLKIPRFSAPPVSPIGRSAPKIGRNDPCPCGSAKKYKKCCGA